MFNIGSVVQASEIAVQLNKIRTLRIRETNLFMLLQSQTVNLFFLAMLGQQKAYMLFVGSYIS